MKYVLVSGGVISGVGKGIIASSCGLLFKTAGLTVSTIKIDPYLNIDAGLMNPLEHGEVFVCDDGAETDLDLGNYERYLGVTLGGDNNITTGKIYHHVITKERRGDYLGKTVQIVPHLTNEIQNWVERVARIAVDESGREPDVCIIELGGTVGDIESAPFVEAMSQLQRRAGKDNFLQIQVSYVPLIGSEQKTKPTQRAISDVRSAGLRPDLIACRCETPLEEATIQKIANSCQVERDQVVGVHNVSTTYQVPILLEKQGFLYTISQLLKIDAIPKEPKLLEYGKVIWQEWQGLALSQDHVFETVTIALVGKYTSLHDSYMSVSKALEHAAMHCRRKLQLIWVESTNLEEEHRINKPGEYYTAWHHLTTANGILVPGGFGERGTEGMIKSAQWARANNVPYLGICLGMQLAVVEFARNVCGMDKAGSAEFNEQCEQPVIVYMPEIDKSKMGGTMRLGKRATIFQEGSEWSRLRKLYGEKQEVWERHRHRYEVNPALIEKLEAGGLSFIGKDEAGERMEIIELKDHKWYVGVQFHPEYLSRVLAPSKTFLGFFAAAAGCLEPITEVFKDRHDLSHQQLKLPVV
ncbi:putative CTP synthase [Aspergillus steynii IBT 23096]|uniref:CTP synthase n=1 Tax=Aspergillus steynii IBT 23096 TaxID=1392250 RepID=A0A2I2GMM1_9EURO|nr:putative CTP synthase [Aspergillus steynii IBT 23096]PLB54115.1 putative CTP synthase [Aspergillus steynii IBT 23096]